MFDKRPEFYVGSWHFVRWNERGGLILRGVEKPGTLELDGEWTKKIEEAVLIRLWVGHGAGLLEFDLPNGGGSQEFIPGAPPAPIAQA